MSQRIKFINKSKQMPYLEIGKNINFEGVPEVFNNDYDGHAKLSVIDAYGMFFVGSDKAQKPLSYFRHTDILKNEFRFGNLIELGDDFLKPQKRIIHPEKAAMKGEKITPYTMLSQSPEIYGFSSTERVCEYRIYDDCAVINEGDFLKFKAEPWPFTIYDHQSFYPNASMILQPSTFSGILDGQYVMGLGSYDRFCIGENISHFDEVPMGYISFAGMGIRMDGRKECTCISASINPDGKTIAYYILEGEQPIVTDEVEIEAEWHYLPYVEDKTCAYKTAVFRFCGKEIHFEAKWGAKGFTEKPRVEKHGQSQVFGVWYEGKIPYKHRLYYTIGECMEAYDYKLKDIGFDIMENF